MTPFWEAILLLEMWRHNCDVTSSEPALPAPCNDPNSISAPVELTCAKKKVSASGPQSVYVIATAVARKNAAYDYWLFSEQAEIQTWHPPGDHPWRTTTFRMYNTLQGSHTLCSGPVVPETWDDGSGDAVDHHDCSGTSSRRNQVRNKYPRRR